MKCELCKLCDEVEAQPTIDDATERMRRGYNLYEIARSHGASVTRALYIAWGVKKE